jgi:hypothetical protein
LWRRRSRSSLYSTTTSPSLPASSFGRLVTQTTTHFTHDTEINWHASRRR